MQAVLTNKPLAFTASLLVALAFISLTPAISGAAPVEKVAGFVCPVFNSNSQAGHKNPNAVPIAGGDYTILGPEVYVPAHATNDDGAGTPGGDHASPGDKNYSAIWGVRP